MALGPKSIDEDRKIAQMVEAAERKRVDKIVQEKRQALQAAERMLAVKKARDDLITFTELTMPDKEMGMEDALATRYKAKRFHRALAAALEEVEAGRILRLMISFPPRHGKSELANRRFMPWAIGRDPYRNIALGTYNSTFAEDWGQKIRGVMQSPEYKQIFPNVEFQKGAQSVKKLITTEGGELHFVGRGGGITGRGADIIIIDDPIKDAEEADSPTVREKTWEWFTDTFGTRLMSDLGAIIIIMTRWHEDDLIGRITDPRNINYNEDYAKQWKKFEIRAEAEDDDILGRKLGEPLWPEKFGTEYLSERKRLSPKSFASLYQQRPAPEEGTFFKAEWLQEYNDPSAIPHDLKKYAASDHALGEKEENDRNCLGVFGVDSHDNIWILPDLYWQRSPTDVTTEAMLDLMRRHNPLLWFAAADHIGRSIGPFLRKRMKDDRIYVPIHEMTETKDKQRRAQSIRGRTAMRMVYFPRFAPWWQEARSELLTFPQATHDDFVDFLSLIGRGLDYLQSASLASNDNSPKQYSPGTFGWIKQESDRLKAFNNRRRLSNGW